PPCATDTWRIPLRGRHLRRTVYTFDHWTTSFLGESVIGRSQPAQLLGPPKPHRSCHAAPWKEVVDPWTGDMLRNPAAKVNVSVRSCFPRARAPCAPVPRYLRETVWAAPHTRRNRAAAHLFRMLSSSSQDPEELRI